MSKILVNTRFLIKDKLEGIGRFTYEVLKRIVENHPEHEFHFVFDRPWDEAFIFAKNVFPLKVGPQARHPFLWYLWFEHSLPAIISKIKPDLILSTDGYTTFKTRIKKVTVFHDLAFEHYPKDIGWMVRKYYQSFTPGFTQVTNRIATVSEYSKQDLVKTYGVDHAKIDVVYNGANSYFTPIDEAQQKEVKEKYTSQCEYFCFVGALQPRKNIVNLFKAFDQFKSQTNSEVKLLLVGRKAWKAKEIFQTYESMKYKQDVIFTGHLKHQEIAAIYGASLGLIYIPYFEGFGIPIIEAQNCNCPVITSNVTSMPEVAGEGALLVNPFQIEEIANAIHTLATDSQVRENLIEKGQSNVKRFSWDITAEKLWETIAKTLAN